MSFLIIIIISVTLDFTGESEPVSDIESVTPCASRGSVTSLARGLSIAPTFKNFCGCTASPSLSLPSLFSLPFPFLLPQFIPAAMTKGSNGVHKCPNGSSRARLPNDIWYIRGWKNASDESNFNACSRNKNKFAQSNLGRWPRCGTVAHVRRKNLIGYNSMPQIHPKSIPSRGPIPKPHYLSYPWTCLTYDAKQHLDLIRHFSTMHWTDWPTDRSSTAKFDHYRPLHYESNVAQ